MRRRWRHSSGRSTSGWRPRARCSVTTWSASAPPRRDPDFWHGETPSAPCSPTRASCRSCASGSATAFGWTASTASACGRGCHAAYCMPITGPALLSAERRPGATSRSGRTRSPKGSWWSPSTSPTPGRTTAGSAASPAATRATSGCRGGCRARDRPFVVVPEVPAGSAILFTEALTHGTAAWQGPHERRSLLYKYCVSHIAWTAPGGAAACHGAHRAAEDPVPRAGRPAPALPVPVREDRAAPRTRIPPRTRCTRTRVFPAARRTSSDRRARSSSASPACRRPPPPATSTSWGSATRTCAAPRRAPRGPGSSAPR